MRFEGILTTWNDDRGFGFIQPTQGGDELFVHIKAFAPGTGRPALQQRVTFEVGPGPRGRQRAIRVQRVRPAPVARAPVHPRASRAPWGVASLLVLPAFLVLYLVIAVRWRLPGLVAVAYLGASALAFVTYAVDKSAARRGAWRVPERSLHLLSTFCGWPGAMLAQQLLRHKSSKRSFRAAFWGTVALNVAAFVALSTPLGARLLAGT